MTNVRLQGQPRWFLTAMVLLCSIGLFACSWPWPSMTEDTTGLGKSEIAKVLADSCCSHPDWRIAQKIRIALEKAGKGRPSRAATESVGFTCEDLPSRTCRYAGEMTYQIYGAPRENKDFLQRGYMVSYSIVLPNYDEPLVMRIHQIIAPAP